MVGPGGNLLFETSDYTPLHQGPSGYPLLKNWVNYKNTIIFVVLIKVGSYMSCFHYVAQCKYYSITKLQKKKIKYYSDLYSIIESFKKFKRNLTIYFKLFYTLLSSLVFDKYLVLHDVHLPCNLK